MPTVILVHGFSAGGRPRTGAASGVLIAATSGFRPLSSSVSLDLRVPERRALFLIAVGLVLRGVNVDERQDLVAG